MKTKTKYRIYLFQNFDNVFLNKKISNSI